MHTRKNAQTLLGFGLVDRVTLSTIRLITGFSGFGFLGFGAKGAVLFLRIVGDPPAASLPRFQVPLFLLNYIVRFWRTLTVDYASKKWRRSNAGWALRNVKVRMSRKLLFAKGILLCFLCDEQFAGKPSSEGLEVVNQELLSYCFHLSRRPALQLLAESPLELAADEAARKVMDAYDRFLEMLDDNEKRDHLERLEFGQDGDALFEEQRRNNRDLRDGFETLFFAFHDRSTQLAKRYGVV